MALFADLAWREDGEDIVSTLVDDIFESAAARTAEKAIQAKVLPYTQQWVMSALIDAVHYHFMQIDEGDDLEGDAAGAWEIDEEPVPSPVDTWATHSIPIRHTPNPPSPHPMRMTDAEEAAMMRQDMLRRRSRLYSVSQRSRVGSSVSPRSRVGSREFMSSSSGLNDVTEDQNQWQSVNSVNSGNLAMPTTQSYRRFRSASISFPRSGAIDLPHADLEPPTLQGPQKQRLQGLQKPRNRTATTKSKRESAVPKEQVSTPSPEQRKTPKAGTQHQLTSKICAAKINTKALVQPPGKPVDPIRSPDERDTTKSTLDDIITKQSERELAGIAKIARETNGSFAYDFQGKLIPVKKVDGDILPRYSFQAQIAITTNTSATSNATAEEGPKPNKVINTKQVSREQKQLKLHKARGRKVKVA